MSRMLNPLSYSSNNDKNFICYLQFLFTAVTVIKHHMAFTALVSGNAFYLSKICKPETEVQAAG